MSGILVTMWRDFSFYLILWSRLWLTCEGQKKSFAVRWRSNFFTNFGHFLGSFNPVFYSYFKNIGNFKIGPKLIFLRCFFHGTIISSVLEYSSRNVNRLWEDFQGHLLLWGTIWEEFCSQCDSHCEEIVRRLWVEMNNLNLVILKAK